MISIILLLTLIPASFLYVVDPGPLVKATKGEVWPLPQSQLSLRSNLWIEPANFKFEVINHKCDIIDEAIDRYRKIINREHHFIKKFHMKKLHFKHAKTNNLTALSINLTAPCENMPHLNMDESYNLNIYEPNNATLLANSVWGILRGMETFSQLLWHNKDDGPVLRVNLTYIEDTPRFKHRGLLLDTSRHYLPLFVIYENLRAMSFNKLNVLHWHIVDDQSFPYQSFKFPDLSRKGAYHPTMIYTPEDVVNVIEYARNLGIRVIPEFDTPGHTRSWGEAFPEILTPCYKDRKPDGHYGPLNPTRESTYTFVQDLFNEIVQVFPDEYVHLGGDEVGTECWRSNPEIQDFVRINNSTYDDLEKIYLLRLFDIVKGLKAKSIVWEEVFTNKIPISKEAIIQIWTNSNYLDSSTSQGYPSLLSACWYLDHLASGGDWQKYYKCDPYKYVTNTEQRKLILGGEACMWGEAVDATNALSRIWPRASAVAEKLWSKEYAQSEAQAARRLEEHTCRMNKRGIPAQPPNGPGFCI